MARDISIDTMTVMPQQVHNGVLYTQYRIALRDEIDADVDEQFVPFGTMSATFSAVAPGIYTLRVELSNGDGSQVGPGVTSDPFEVPDDDATLEVPATVTVAVGPMAQ